MAAPYPPSTHLDRLTIKYTCVGPFATAATRLPDPVDLHEFAVPGQRVGRGQIDVKPHINTVRSEYLSREETSINSKKQWLQHK